MSAPITDRDWLPLCRLDDLPPSGSQRVAFPGDSHAHGLCVVRQGEVLYAYLNRCPHQDMAMDWLPGRFLDAAGEHIVCSMHGARFRVRDGYCVSGPCEGQCLVSVRLETRAGIVGVQPQNLSAFSDAD